MRLIISLTPEEVDKALFTCKPKAQTGQIILNVSTERFKEILSRFIEFKEDEKIRQLAREASL